MRVVGALSFGIGDYGNKTLLATPIEADARRAGRAAVSARRARRACAARPLGIPLSLAGLSPRVADAFRTAAGAPGARSTPSRPARAPRTSPSRRCAPGSAVAVGYSSGDVGFGAVGTVTYVDGNSIWAFGHPLDSVGRRALFLQDAFVNAIISSPSTGTGQGTYKLAVPGHDIGTLSGDGIFSVGGTVGALPAALPDGRQRQGPRHRHDPEGRAAARRRARRSATRPASRRCGFVGSGAVAQAAYTTLHGSPLHTSGDMCVSIAVRERTKPMGFCNTYVAAGTGLGRRRRRRRWPARPGHRLRLGRRAAGLLPARAAARHRASTSTLSLQRGLAQAFMASCRRRSASHARQRLPASRLLRQARRRARPGRASACTSPRGMPTGRRDLVLTGTPSDLAGGGDLAAASLFEARSRRGRPDVADRAVQADRRDPPLRRRHRELPAAPQEGRAARPDRPPTTRCRPAPEGKALRERPVYRDRTCASSGAVSLPVIVR